MTSAGAARSERTSWGNVPAAIADLRRLLYCGEWIQSHVLHTHMLHAPDFLGYESGISLAADNREAVERGLADAVVLTGSATGEPG